MIVLTPMELPFIVLHAVYFYFWFVSLPCIIFAWLLRNNLTLARNGLAVLTARFPYVLWTLRQRAEVTAEVIKWRTHPVCNQQQRLSWTLLHCYSNSWVNIYQVHLAAVAAVFTRPPSGGDGEPLALMKTTQVARLSACYKISQKPLFPFIRRCCLGWTLQASLRLQPRFPVCRLFPANQLETVDPAPSFTVVSSPIHSNSLNSVTSLPTWRWH